jgi:DNA-binding response OmpR family regulator
MAVSSVTGEFQGIGRILVVDDDPKIRQLVDLRLTPAGYEVLTAASGEEALGVIERQGLPHLAIVDIVMPGMNGFEFCEVVQRFSDLPVILLTAMGEEDTVVEGIERFAEDYIVKPFSPRELLARVQRVLRRIGDFAYTLEPVIRVDARLSVDIPHQKALVADDMIDLTPTETKLLYILMRNASHVVTTDFLLRRLWPLEEVFEDTLRVHVHRLRQKIEEDPGAPCYIITERGLGYRFGACPDPGKRRSSK